MPTQNVSLSEHFYDFIQRCVDSGRYQNASEVVRAALRVLEQQEKEEAARIQHIKEMIREAEESYARGEYTELRSDEDFDRFFAEIREDMTKRSKRDDAA